MEGSSLTTYKILEIKMTKRHKTKKKKKKINKLKYVFLSIFLTPINRKQLCVIFLFFISKTDIIT